MIRVKAAKVSTAVLLTLAALPGICAGQCGSVQPRLDLLAEFRQTLQRLAPHEPNPCGGYTSNEDAGEDVRKDEYCMFEQVPRIVEDELNAPLAASKSPRDRATEALKTLETMSSEVNAGWPDENRFHFDVLDLRPILVAKLHIRTHERFFVFALHEESSQEHKKAWREVGSDAEPPDSRSFGKWLDFYPLHRGPSGNARFLATFSDVGCEGMSMGIEYDAHEFDAKAGLLTQIIKQKGASNIEKQPQPKEFEKTGVLRTKGSLITLPYCWFSAIDTWDNPSMCAVDTYDLSGDEVTFRSRSYNWPDLAPIAKAVEYAEKHDYPAVRAYCTSARVARRLVRNPYVGADSGASIQRKRTGKGKERIEMGESYIDVEKHAGRWLVADFGASHQ